MHTTQKQNRSLLHYKNANFSWKELSESILTLYMSLSNRDTSKTLENPKENSEKHDHIRPEVNWVQFNLSLVLKFLNENSFMGGKLKIKQ